MMSNTGGLDTSLANLTLIANEYLGENVTAAERFAELRSAIFLKKKLLDIIIEKNMNESAWGTVYETLKRTIRLVTRKLEPKLTEEFNDLFLTLGKQMETVRGSKPKRKICHESIFLTLNLVINIAEVFVEDNIEFIEEIKMEIANVNQEIRALRRS